VNRCTGHVILGVDRLTSHAAQMDREPELKIIRRAFAKQRRDAVRGCMARPAKGGGRLILPLTADGFPNRDVRRGIVFRIERCGPEFFACRISGVAIFPCEGGRDEGRRTGTRCGLRQGRRRARDPAVPAGRFAGRPMLAARAGLVSRLPLMHRTFYIRLARVEGGGRAVGSLFPLEGCGATIRSL
jgi:hypothetical protein